MKIGILTQPLKSNYGGLLQAFALQHCLINLGHDPVTINRDFLPESKQKKIISLVKRILLRYIKGRKDIIVFPLKMTNEEHILYTRNTSHFTLKNIITTKRITKFKELSDISKNFDALIVGSDQVWRPKYSPSIYNYFLDFASKSNNLLKLSYAASFGVDQWEFTEKDTKICKDLLKNFDGISVREDSGVLLCKENLNQKAEHVLDPTFLLDKNEYVNMINKEDLINSSKTLMAYVLDTSDQKIAYLKQISNELNVTLVHIDLETRFTIERRKNLDDYILPSISKWLSEFYKADYIITDSFHGTAFSIIFNKKFISIGNKKRGISRFTSILKLFDLSERLVYSFEEINSKKLKNSIDYNKVNSLISKHKRFSIDYLKKFLNKQ
jgi:hypothetical protein